MTDNQNDRSCPEPRCELHAGHYGYHEYAIPDHDGSEHGGSTFIGCKVSWP